MALRNAYKQRAGSDGDDRDHIGSIHSVDNLTRGGNRTRTPGETGTRVASKTSEVIENAFGFLKGSIYDTYSRYGSDADSEAGDIVDYRGNFTFGPPRTSAYRAPAGIGPTSGSYDGEAPRDRRYRLDAADQMSYDDDISRMGGVSLSPDRYRIKRLPRVNENGTALPIDRRYVGPQPRYSYDPRGRANYDSYGRNYGYRPQYRSYPDEFSEDDWYPDDGQEGYFYRHPPTRDDYDRHANGGMDYPSDDAEHAKSDKLLEEDRGKTWSKKKKCLYIGALVIGLLIAAGIIIPITLHFLGFFNPEPKWADGYDVEAVFANEYRSVWDDQNSNAYKQEEDKFKKLTQRILDKDYQGAYALKVNNITKGSTKYIFMVELSKRINNSNLENLLQDGYIEAKDENFTELIFKSIQAKVNQKYEPAGATTMTAHTDAVIESTTEQSDMLASTASKHSTPNSDDGNGQTAGVNTSPIAVTTQSSLKTTPAHTDAVIKSTTEQSDMSASTASKHSTPNSDDGNGQTTGVNTLTDVPTTKTNLTTEVPADVPTTKSSVTTEVPADVPTTKSSVTTEVPADGPTKKSSVTTEVPTDGPTTKSSVTTEASTDAHTEQSTGSLEVSTDVPATMSKENTEVPTEAATRETTQTAQGTT